LLDDVDVPELRSIKKSKEIENKSSENEFKDIANLIYIWKSQDRDKNIIELLKRIEKLKNKYSILITILSLILHKFYSNSKYYRKKSRFL
jgi:hypothetical protein